MPRVRTTEITSSFGLGRQVWHGYSDMEGEDFEDDVISDEDDSDSNRDEQDEQDTAQADEVDEWNEYADVPELLLDEWVVTFDNLPLDEFAALKGTLAACLLDIMTTRVHWQTDTDPMAEELEMMCETAAKETTTTRSTSRNTLNTGDLRGPSDHDLNPLPNTSSHDTGARSARIVLRAIRAISAVADEMRQIFWKLVYRSRPEDLTELLALYQHDRERLNEVLVVDRQAWTCILWFWMAYQVSCKALIKELGPLLRAWDNWAWKDSRARSDGLRLLAFLVERRMRVWGGAMMDRGAWRRALGDHDIEAFYWLERGR